MKNIFFVFFIFATTSAAQTSPIYSDLPLGKYAVGFKIITITDDSRVTMPEYNYFGEKNPGDRHRKIIIHLWYPARPSTGNRTVTYGDYCYSELLQTTRDTLSTPRKNTQLAGRRREIERWFGKTTDDAWQKLVETHMLAQTEAEPLNEKFPLLVGMLRPLSTSITNELLASNGYVVAMVSIGGTLISEAAFAFVALNNVPDMQFAISHLLKNENVDENNIGAFGFSGSGFNQVHLAMFDYRIKALADIESGLYMEGLFQALSTSNYYNPSRLNIPFLHIFSRDLSKEEKYIAEFEQKTKFSKRYRLLLNQPALHHWDFAAEGYVSAAMLKNRGTAQDNIQRSFEIASHYLLNFFNSELKNDQRSKIFLATKPVLEKTESALWDITVLNAAKPAPKSSELEYLVRTRGVKEALTVVNNTLPADSLAEIRQSFVLNSLAYVFLREKKYAEGIGIFKLNTEIHPGDPNLFDSLSEGYEASGDIANMKTNSQKVLELLNKKTTLTTAENALKTTADRRIKM